MKHFLIGTALVGFSWLHVQSQSSTAPQLSLRQSGGAVELSWPGTVSSSDGNPVRPYFELQRSSDLRLWQPVGERIRASATCRFGKSA